MDKVSVNNEIVSMRQEVRRAKVHVISKLVRESRKLKTKKGTDQQKEKYLKKAERFAELVLLVKKLKEDAVSKFALSNTRSSAELLADTSLPLETKAFARLAAHKNMANRVNKFQSRFPNWETELPPIVAEIGSRSKKRPRNKPSRKETKSRGPNNEDDGSVDSELPSVVTKIGPKFKKRPSREEVQASAPNSGDDDSEDDISEVGNETEMPPILTENMSKFQKKSTSVPHNIDDDSEYSECSVSPVLKERTVKKVKKSLQKTDVPYKRKENSVAEVRRFTDIWDKESDRGVVDIPEDKPVVGSTVDPFFVTDDGKEGYFSIVATEFSSDKDVPRTFSTSRETSRDGVQEEYRKTNTHFKSFQNRYNNEPRGLNRKERRFKEFQQKKGKTDAIVKSSTARDPEVLHPSWEAKRKLKETQFATFQGKKIKFVDENE